MTTTTNLEYVRCAIAITDYDLAFGKRSSRCHCPIARAVRRLLRPYYQALVDVAGIHIEGPDGCRQEVILDHLDGIVLADFIEDFDAGREVPAIQIHGHFPRHVLSAY